MRDLPFLVPIPFPLHPAPTVPPQRARSRSGLGLDSTVRGDPPGRSLPPAPPRDPVARSERRRNPTQDQRLDRANFPAKKTKYVKEAIRILVTP